MGCSSSTAKKVEEQSSPTQSPSTLTGQTPEERALLQLKLVFDSVDANKDGTVVKDELIAALEKDESLGCLIKEAGFNLKYNVLSDLDTNKDGCVSWEEFEGNLKEKAVEEVTATGGLAAAELPANEKALTQLRAIFDSIDKNGDHAVSKDELTAKLNDLAGEHGVMSDSRVGHLVAEAGFNPSFYTFDQLDTNKDGLITWEEFEANLRSAAKKEVKETGQVSAARVLQEPQEIDGCAAPICGGCW